MTNPVHILFHFVLIPTMLGRWSRSPLKWCTKSMIQILWLPESSFGLFPEPHSAHSSSDSWAIYVVCPDSPWSSWWTWGPATCSLAGCDQFSERTVLCDEMPWCSGPLSLQTLTQRKDKKLSPSFSFSHFNPWRPWLSPLISWTLD